MQRRQLLALAGLTGLGGCLGYDVVDSEAVTDRKVRIAELEAKLDRRDELLAERDARIEELEAGVARRRDRQRAPRINAVGIVDRWDRIGDVVERRIDAVPPGEPARIAVNFTYRRDRPTDTPGSTPAVGVVARLLTLEGFRIERVGRRIDLSTDSAGSLHETVVTVDVNRFPTGTYIAVVELTDLVSGRSASNESILLPVG
ncbi:hypothetical protein [Salinirubrum litoreum]|uniref:Uncharacterized protein n=1 Tax=Salinirubrum litoreum TaxID=1126234 RepID=A0ABD5RGC6_9EURY|nr:hypothetical protein [Salinirubrum litoreum]